MKLLEFFFNGGNNKSKFFTKEEVKKHNTVDDGMLIVNGFVYKIPEKWITIDHPGGNVISKYLGKDNIKITVDLGLGIKSSRILTCDLSKQYIDINASYKT